MPKLQYGTEQVVEKVGLYDIVPGQDERYYIVDTQQDGLIADTVEEGLNNAIAAAQYQCNHDSRVIFDDALGTWVAK